MAGVPRPRRSGPPGHLDRLLVGGVLLFALTPVTPGFSVPAYYALVVLSAVLCGLRARALPRERTAWTLTLHRLAALGCDLVQGYVLSPPLPAAELAAWHARRRGAAAA